MDTPEQEEAVDDGLKPGLDDLGYEVAAESVLPCPEGTQTCEQHDVAIQRMQDAGVDFVFLTAQTLAGSATVEAAANLGFEPEWATIGNNVTDTVARFYVNAKDNYDGAWGIDTVFPDRTPTKPPSAIASRSPAAPRSSRAGRDGYGFTAVTCLQLQTLVAAIEAVDGTITQAAVIEAFESLERGPDGRGPAGLARTRQARRGRLRVPLALRREHRRVRSPSTTTDRRRSPVDRVDAWPTRRRRIPKRKPRRRSRRR